jgi:hypothetical protein
MDGGSTVKLAIFKHTSLLFQIATPKKFRKTLLCLLCGAFVGETAIKWKDSWRGKLIRKFLNEK